MKYIGQAQDVANEILKAFECASLPEALAQVFILRKDNAPCRKWSWNNQVLIALHGYSQARGLRQWQEVGRQVKAGEHAMHILAPLTKTIAEKDTSGEEVRRSVIFGFKTIPVFGLEQTAGEPLSTGDPDIDSWIRSLPLREVAESWGLVVQVFSGREDTALGYFVRGRSIGLGVENLSTWAHELIHAADHRNGELVEKAQHWRSEVVAELGGAILLECLALGEASDRGGCWQYIETYARTAGIEPLTACAQVLDRTCRAVAAVLNEAERISGITGSDDRVPIRIEIEAGE